MLSKYSKLAVAAAIAGACGYVSAGTINVTGNSAGNDYSIEGAALNTTTVSITRAASVVLGSGARKDVDEIKLILSGTAKFESAAAGAVSVICTSGALRNNELASPSGTLVFRPSTSVNSGATCGFTALSVVIDSFTAAGTYTLGATSTNSGGTSNETISTLSGGSNVVASASSQIVSLTAPTVLNGTVDFQNQLGLGFASSGADTVSGVTGYADEFGLLLTTKETQNSYAGALSMQFAINAESGKDFSFLCNSDVPTVLNSSNATATYGGTSGINATINSNCNQISVNGNVTLVAGTTLYPLRVGFGATSQTPSTGVVIKSMTFPTTVATAKIRSSLVETSSALTVGTWSSNGSTVEIPYMPINTTAGASRIDPVIVISNRSAAEGSISATVRNETGASCSIGQSVLGSIAAQSTKSIGGAIRDAIAGSTCSTLGTVEKVSVTLSVTLPSTTTEVYSGYTVGSTNRVTVVNSSNGK